MLKKHSHKHEEAPPPAKAVVQETPKEPAKADAQRELLSPPGDTILETITHMDISRQGLAERLGLPITHIDDLIRGHAKLTPDIAEGLQKALGIDHQFWINREAEYRRKLQEIGE